VLGVLRLFLALQALLVVGPSTENGRLQTETRSIHAQEFRAFGGGQAPYLSNNDVYEASFGKRGELLRGTGGHPLYSLDRDDWVRIRDLQVGERLQTTEGAVTVEALEKVRGEHRVYNLEIEGDHEYLVGEAGIRTHNSCPDIDKLSQAAGASAKGGRTQAGRALQKHGGREGSTFPRVAGKDLDSVGQDIGDDILTAPGSVTSQRHHARYGDVIEVRHPDGRGVRFKADDKSFMGFLEPE